VGFSRIKGPLRVPLSGLRGLPNVKSGHAVLTREEEGQRTGGTPHHWCQNFLQKAEIIFPQEVMRRFESKSVRKEVGSPIAYTNWPCELLLLIVPCVGSRDLKMESTDRLFIHVGCEQIDSFYPLFLGFTRELP
jgi:hypothetical protein